MPLQQLITRIRAKDIPPVILIGGDSEYLVEKAFSAVRDEIVAADPSVSLESYAEVADLGVVIDSYRTMSLFAPRRLLVVPEVNAFVTRKEVADLFEKSLNDWSTAKTDRKRSTAIAKLLHLLGLLGFDTDVSSSELTSAVGVRKEPKELADLLEAARASGKNATRGEGDAALLAEAIQGGGAPGATLLLKTGPIPSDSATVRLISQRGAVVVRDLARDEFLVALEEAVSTVARDCKVKFDKGAFDALKSRLGFERILNDKWSSEIPDLRIAVSEAERLATFVGEGGTVTAAIVNQQVGAVGGGARWELGSLFAEGKAIEAVAKLRELIAQAKREDARAANDVVYGRFIFPLADEIRQLIGIHSFARIRGIDLRKTLQYNRFRDTIAEPLSEYLKEHAIVRQKPHPFPLHKRFEAARAFSENELIDGLMQLAEMDVGRKSGGGPIEVGIESFVLGARRS